MTIGIVNSGMGNIGSVVNALLRVGGTPRILGDPVELRDVDRVILPGVGAFADGMAKLRNGGWIPALEEAVRGEGKLFLGLCVGMQLLADRGTEHGDCAGLGWIPGVVRRLTSTDPSIRIPHIGWNDLEVVNAKGLYRGVKTQPICYFVHSYVFAPADPSVTTAYCTYGERFSASVEWKNIFATQYHPEKSQECGLAVLRNFISV
jgi:imidazole glycerol-phosphate synthase subunit HisH